MATVFAFVDQEGEGEGAFDSWLVAVAKVGECFWWRESWEGGERTDRQRQEEIVIPLRLCPMASLDGDGV